MLGAGALGGTIGGTLARAGADVVLIDRWQAHVDAINANGLRLRLGDTEHALPLMAAVNCDGLPPADLVIVLVKSFDTRSAIEAAAAVVGSETTVLSLQNGLGHDAILADVLGARHVLAGKTYAGGVLLGPGHVRGGIDGKETVIGELDGTISARARAIAAEFSRAGLATTVTHDIRRTIWEKLLINVATGALSGITRLPYGGLYAVPEVEECAIAAVAEAMAVARALGIVLTTREPREAWEKAAVGLGPEFKASMLQSLEQGSPTEVDFINGQVVLHGERCGVPTPVNRTLVAAIKGIELSLASRPRTAGNPA